MTRALQPLAECDDTALAGGKAANLGRLLRAGFAVPDGFVITTQAGEDGRLPDAVRGQVVAAWKALGATPVAVRSSASQEDGAEASAAGQFDSFLDVTGEEALLAAIGRCRDSFRNRRADAYRSVQAAVSEAGGMAVIVQRFVPAEVSGVLFTADPQQGDALRVEAARGTGEALVSGRIRPEVWRIARATGAATAMEGGDFSTPCLDEATLRELWEVGCKVAAALGAPQDIEWAICGGKLFVLQARPITAGDFALARGARIEALKTGLRAELAAGRGAWALHNLSETLRSPTTLTWSVMERYLSPSGGFGQLYRRVGFAPSESASRLTIARCIGGGIYTDLAAAPAMFGLALRYDLELVRRDPAAAQTLPTLPTGSLLDRLRTQRCLSASRRRLRAIGLDLGQRLSEQVIPDFAAWCLEEKERDLRAIDADGWLELWRERERRVFDEFAPEVLLATLVSGAALAELRTFVVKHAWDEDPDALVQALCADPEAAPAIADLTRLARRECSLSGWLERWGHRGPDEMELASPRWREQPGHVEELAAATLGAAHAPVAQAKSAALFDRLTIRDAQELTRLAEFTRRCLRFRETGRHWTMLGHDLLRDLALEAGRRLGIAAGIFHLTPDEIAQALRSGSAPREVIARREKERSLDRTIFLPPLIDAAAIETLGELPAAPDGSELRGSGISAGTAAGRVRIVERIDASAHLEPGEILVCSTLDPNLTPLFLRAGGLIVECGGALSHAAIVAREMNLPAVVLPGATAILGDGMNVMLDGSSGLVRRIDAAGAGELAPPLPAELIPPPPTRRENTSTNIRNVLGAFWCLVLLAVFVLPPQWLRLPCMAAFDAALWPMVVAFGNLRAVAVVAAVLAFVVAAVQRLLTDNHGLRIAKVRAQKLSRLAGTLPEGTQREHANRLTGGVQRRLIVASWMAPAVLLGPLALTLLWLSHRLDPAKGNPPPGTDFTVVATVRSDFRNAVLLEVPLPLRIDPVTPVAQSVPPIRETLERILAKWAAQDAPPREKIAELRAYLAKGVPPQKLLWKVTAGAAPGGVFPVTTRMDRTEPVSINVVFGANRPPTETSLAGHGALRSVELVYANPVSPEPFWKPLAWVGIRWDAGWLGVYLVAYLAAAALFRGLLRLA